jgi:hypothetical protein
MADQTPREVIKDALDRFQRNFDRMVDPAASEEDRRQSVANSIHFFSYVTLLEEIRRSNPERAEQLNRWIGDMLEDGGCGEIVYQWREELAAGREITLPAPPVQSPQDVTNTPCPVSLGGPEEAASGELGAWASKVYGVLLSFYGEHVTADQRDHVTSMTRAIVADASPATAGWRPPVPAQDVSTLVSVVGGLIDEHFGDDDHPAQSRAAAKAILDGGFLDKTGVVGPPEPVATTLRRIIADLETEAMFRDPMPMIGAYAERSVDDVISARALSEYAERLRKHPALSVSTVDGDKREEAGRG